MDGGVKTVEIKSLLCSLYLYFAFIDSSVIIFGLKWTGGLVLRERYLLTLDCFIDILRW